jgi:phage minor structural protein, N-terminal region
MTPALFADGLTTAPASGSIGIGRLSDCISCKVEREINGMYELTMQYPRSGQFYDSIALRSLLLVEPDQITGPQLFRVYRIGKPMKGIVTINARHISYDMAGYVVEPFTALSIATALSGITDHATPECPFSFSTTRDTAATFNVRHPDAIWSLMAGQEGSLLDVFGGEYDFDNFSVTLENHLGTDRGVTIRYGKNLKDLKQEENCAAVYTDVFPYYYDITNGILVTLPEKTIEVGVTTAYDRVLSLDLTDRFQEPPTEDSLRTAAENYIATNNLGVPEVSLTVNFVPLWQTEEYKDVGLLESVQLGDTVTVQFPELGVDATARAVAFVYDCLKERYESVTLGRVKTSLAAIVAAQAKEIEDKPTASLVEQISTMLSQAMMGVHGGAVRLVDTNGDGMPDELYIADSPNPEEAVIVWRFNYLGWAVSQSGYNGDYVMGATLQDGLLANFVTAAHLRAGTIQSADGESFNLDLDNGILEMNAQYFALNGNNLDDYFHISFEGGSPVVRIGSSSNGIVLKQMSDRISFCDTGGNELAYWNNNSFRLTELQSFQLGNLELVSQPNGSVSFVKASS